jgi:hypothetical protein
MESMKKNKVNGLGILLVFKVQHVGNKKQQILQSYYQYVSSKQSKSKTKLIGI